MAAPYRWWLAHGRQGGEPAGRPAGVSAAGGLNRAGERNDGDPAHQNVLITFGLNGGRETGSTNSGTRTALGRATTYQASPASTAVDDNPS
ncbi:MAG TPA: hypothetical protein VID93_06005, partial [Acidimicrobiales bacterium]